MLYERLFEILKNLSFTPIENNDDEYLNQKTMSIAILGEKGGFSRVVKYHFNKESKQCIGCEVV